MLKRKDIKMIHKWLREGMSKSAIAKRLGISRETVRKYILKSHHFHQELVLWLYLHNKILHFFSCFSKHHAMFRN